MKSEPVIMPTSSAEARYQSTWEHLQHLHALGVLTDADVQGAKNKLDELIPEAFVGHLVARTALDLSGVSSELLT